MHIGFDLDNTLISYDKLFLQLAQEARLLPNEFQSNGKTTVRDAVRSLHGDEAWQHLQAQAYGERLKDASLFPDVLNILRSLKKAGHRISIISHKTRYSPLLGQEGTDLHEAARSFFMVSRLADVVDDVAFTPTREEKCAAIAKAGCNVFVDDLPEVFSTPDFPAHCRKILFSEEATHTAVLRRWRGLPLLLEPENVAAEALSCGRNSRVRRLGEMVIKRYPRDGRARCRTEWQALVWLRRQGIPHTPEPLACDPMLEYTVMDYIHGTAARDSISSTQAMINFALKLYKLKDRAQHFPPAADACFSKADFIAQLTGRLASLSASPAESEVETAMHDFLRQRLGPALSAALDAYQDTGGVLPHAFRMPSPSDFGLHNALQRPDNSLVFCDFEYFGLDDPAKLMADVSLHPGMPLSLSRRNAFIEALASACENAGDSNIRARYAAVLPLWRLKWCCILLNEFLPLEIARRVFSGACHEKNKKMHLQDQLDKAQKMLFKI